nr:hypothetical protein Iba_chr03dCG4410 [Ipomoea batatas]
MPATGDFPITTSQNKHSGSVLVCSFARRPYARHPGNSFGYRLDRKFGRCGWIVALSIGFGGPLVEDRDYLANNSWLGEQSHDEISPANLSVLGTITGEIKMVVAWTLFVDRIAAHCSQPGKIVKEWVIDKILLGWSSELASEPFASGGTMQPGSHNLLCLELIIGKDVGGGTYLLNRNRQTSS